MCVMLLVAPARRAGALVVAGLTLLVTAAVLLVPAAGVSAQSPSTDATLSALTVNTVSVVGFTAERTSYEFGVASTVATATVAGTATDPGATVGYSGTDADGGTPGHQVTLTAGRNSNAVTVTVTAADTRTTKTYTVNVNRGVTADFGLKSVDDLDGLAPAGNDDPRGIWSNGTTMWVSDEIDDKLYAYNMSDGTRDSSKDFNLRGNNDRARGLFSDGTTMWVADSADDRIFAYDMVTRRGISSNMRLPAENRNTADLWSDGTTMWVLDTADDHIYAYNISTNSASNRSREMDKEFDTLVSDKGRSTTVAPLGIWSDGTTMWVANNTHSDYIYAYNMSDKMRNPALDFEIGDSFVPPPWGTRTPAGIWSDGTTMWVGDNFNNKVYSFNHPMYIKAAEVDGASLTITFNQELAAAANLANGVFTVKKTPYGGAEETVALTGSPTIDGMTVTLTLASAVSGTDGDVTVSYVKPDTTVTTEKLIDAGGDDVASFTDQDVVNITLSAPGQPTGLTATATGPAQIDLAWTAPERDGNSDITGYKIESSTDGTTFTTVVDSQTATTYSHTGLTAGSVRHYRVSAINSVGTSAPSNTAMDTTNVFVRNTGQTAGDNLTAYQGIAQSFTTGNHPHGYILTGFDVVVGAPGSCLSYIHSDNTDDLLTQPGTRLAALTGPTTLFGTVTFTAPANTVLEANTTYWFHCRLMSNSFGTTASDSEDGGAAADWGIGNVARTFDSGRGGWAADGDGRSLRMAVRGAEAPDTTLRALTVNSVSVAGFDSDTGSYEAGVASTASTVTVLGTPTDASATVGYSVDDADTGSTGHQVSLTAGSNAVTVTVTGRGGVTTREYTVNINRGVATEYGWKASDDLDGLMGANISSPRGIWSNGTTVWVANSTDNKLYAFNMSDKSRDSAKDFSLTGDNADPQGIWSNGTTMWVVGSNESHLYAYKMSDRTRDSSKDITLTSANSSPQGIWSDGVTMWVADQLDVKLYAYTISTKSYDSGKDFTALEAAGNSTPGGIWSDETTMWVTDSYDDKIYAYKMSDKSYDSDRDFNTLATGAGDPWGIWSDGTTMWVVDGGDTKVYSYNHPFYVTSATVDGTSLVIAFNRGLAAAASLDNDEFTVKKTPDGGTEGTVALIGSPAISGKTVTLTLAPAVVGTDGDITVSYVKPTSGSNNKLVDANANQVESFTDQAVTNITVTDAVEVATAPGPPRNLTATATGQTQVNLSWDPPASNGNAAITGYKIEISNDGNRWRNQVSNANPAHTSSSLGLPRSHLNRTRHFRVSAINSAGTSDPSNVATETINVLVRNTGQGDDSSVEADSDRSQRFTTGANSLGYTLTSIEVISEDSEGDDFTAEMWTVDTTTGFPDERHATLTTTDSFAAGTLTFTAPADTVLTAGTTYAIVLSLVGSEDVTYDATTSTDQDHGAATGWGIQDGHEYKNASNAWESAAGSTSLRIVVRGAARTNSAPVFDPTTVTRAVAENTGAGENVGAPVTATDADTVTGDTLTYTLGGTDAASFAIVAGSGQIQTKAALDHEAKSSYTVTVTATDGGSATATATVTITVTDVVEVAAAPGPPRNLTATATGQTQVNLSWDPPASNGNAAITGYKIEFSSDGVANWRILVSNANPDHTTNSIILPRSHLNRTRHFRVSAINSAGTSDPSNVATETINVLVRNTGQGDDSSVEADSDRSQRFTTGANSLGYTLTSIEVISEDSEGDDFTAEIWTVDTTTGFPDERHATLTTTDSFAAGTLTFTAPADTVLTAGATYAIVLSLVGSEDVTYDATTSTDEDASAATGWAIQDGHEFKNASNAWESAAGGTSLRIVVRGAARTNSAPVFDPTTVTRAVAENTAAGQNVGAAVTATDADTVTGDTLTYTLGGTDAASFAIVAGSGQIQTKAALNHEAKASYTVTVTATDGGGATATATVTITVTDVVEVATAPGPPRNLTATATGQTQVNLSWDPPASNGNAAITGYKIEFSSDGVANWRILVSNANPDHTTNSIILPRSHLNRTRHFRVSAINSAGTSDPSNVATETINVLVRNTGQGDDSSVEADSDRSQRFTTGANSLGYTLTSIEVVSEDSEGDDFTAEIWTVDTTTGFPDERHATLTTTDSFAAGTLTFTAPADTVLTAGATYAIVLSLVGSEDVTYDATTSTDQDHGAATGWGIQDGHEYQNTSNVWESAAGGTSLRIVVRGAARTNSAPVFNPATVARAVAENTVAGQDVGAPVTATDADTVTGDTLTYTLGGTDAASFAIVAGSGQIQTKAALDHEAKSSYTVTVTATDGGGATATATVTITVTDVVEVATAPGPPRNLTATATGQTQVNLSWDPPASNGNAAITGYKIEISNDGNRWRNQVSNANPAHTTNSIILPRSHLNRTRHFRVSAINSAGTSDPSNVATETIDVLVRNTGQGDDSSVEADSDRSQRFTTGTNSLGYTLTSIEVVSEDSEGDDFIAAVWTVDTTTGHPDERHATLTTTDSFAAGTLTFTAPADTVLTAGATYAIVLSLVGSEDVTYDATTSTDQDHGAATGWGIQDGHEYKNTSNVWESAAGSTSLRIVVRGAARTNSAPVFNPATVARAVAENTVAGQDVGAPVTATDADTVTGDTLTYTLGGTDAASFAIVAGSGQIQTKAALDHEAKSSYTVTVTATDGGGATATATVTITVTDVVEVATAPGPPRNLTATATGQTQVNLSWDPPASNGNAAITGYKIEISNDGNRWRNQVSNANPAHTTNSIILPRSHLNRTRHFRVSAINSAGTSDPSNVATETIDVLVRNTGQGDDSSVEADSDRSQRFTTGANSLGYTLTSIEVVSEDSEGDDFIAAVWTVDTTTGHPDERHATLTTTDSFAAGTLTFTAPADTVLTAGATYAIVLSLVGSEDVTYDATTSTDQDHGAATGWGIQDGHEYKNTSNVWESAAGSTSLRIVVRGAARTNSAPVFNPATVTRSVAENTAAGQDVGAPVTATDADTVTGDTLTYTLGGTDAASFAIVAGSGQIQTKAALDHEAKSSYTVTVTATDGGSATATATVTITVTDVVEVATAPGPPRNLTATATGQTQVNLSWDPPASNGNAAITGYKIEFSNDGNRWRNQVSNANPDHTTNSIILPRSHLNSTRHFRVSAINSAGTSDPSNVATETIDVLVRNTGQGDDSSVEADSDRSQRFTTGANSLGYTLTSIEVISEDSEGDDFTAEIWTVDTTTGFPDERHATLTTTDSFAAGTLTFTASADTVLTADATYAIVLSLVGSEDVTYDATTSTDQDHGAATGWGIQDGHEYKNTSNVWESAAGGTSLRIVVRGAARTNSAPVFNPATVTRAVAENTGAGENVGAVVTATDADTVAGDTLTYTLGGTDAASFAIVAGSGQIQTKAALNHEAKASYTVTVTATDGSSATATATVTISVTDVDEAPSAPSAPLVAAVPGSSASLKVTWTAPGNDGKPAIESYDVRYRTGGGSWEDGPQNQTGLTATIAGLSASTTYEAQVRATNDEGDSGWSGSGSGTTNAPAAPGAPRGLTATATGPARIDLSWKAPASDGGASISGYKIEVSTNGTSFTGLVDSQTARTYSHTGLSAGSVRHYRVSAINSAGAGAVSATAMDTTNVFVRNTGQGSDANNSSASEQSQRFTTGDHSPGYTLASIEVVSADAEGDDFDAAVWTVNATTGHPVASHATLSSPAGFTAGTLVFTAAANTTLAANTTYAVVLTPDSGGTITYGGTTSDGEDTGAASGWDIEDDHEYKSGSIWRDNGSGRSLRIAVRGAARANSTPVFNPAAVARAVAENTGAGENVGAVVTATDADTVAGDTLTYTLGGTDAASFAIVAGSGQIQTKAALNHEAKASYTVTVTATDGSSATATATVTISVTDVDEAPSAPSAPLVAAVPGSSASLKVTWTAPGNDGKPAIESYDVRYRTGGGSWEDGPQNQTGLTATIAGLSASTTYEAQVRATNDEGDSGWSGSGSGTTNAPANSAPVFNPVTVARAVAENTGAGENVGAVVTATDADTATGDTLSYTLGGADAASFDIVAGSGQIQTKAALNHEAKASYTVTVTATDGSSATATATVTISVTDVDEAPSAPAAPLVAAVPGSTASLKVTWTAPGNDGKPAIASYDVRYRTGGGSWEDGPQNQTGLTATIAGLSASTTYEAQVRATNDEGDSGWSGSGSGTTNAPTAPGRPTGLTATATGPARIDLSWDAPASDGGASISGYKIEVSTNGTSFTGLVDSQTARTYSHTGLSAGSVRHYRVSAINSAGAGAVSATAMDTTNVFVRNTGQGSDANNSSASEQSQRFTTGDHSPGYTLASIEVVSADAEGDDFDAAVWTVNATTGHPVVSHATLSSPAGFTAGTLVFTAAANTTLAANTTYAVVLTPDSGGTITYGGTTSDGEDTGAASGWDIEDDHEYKSGSIWRDNGSGRSLRIAVRGAARANSTPVFNPVTVARAVAENTGAGENVGAVVTATDADTVAGDTLTYTLGGADAASFDIVAGSGQIQTKAALNHEAKPSYSVTVTATDGSSATATATVTISVTDMDEAPSAPAAPLVAAVSGSTASLKVTWTAPGNDGKPAIASYDVRYRTGGGSWEDGPQNQTGLTATIAGLSASTTYEAQVRATNDEGDSGWSRSGEGTTNAPANSAPVFNPVTVARAVAENTGAGENVGAVVTATDADTATGDTLTYTLGGTDAASFAIVAGSGQIQTKAALNHEAKASYTVTVTATDGSSATATATVTISVTDVDEAPSAPAAPLVAAVPGSTASLKVTWTAPGNDGKPAIASYDVRYRTGGGSWEDGPQNQTGLTATIAGLSASTTYEAQVRATNDEGDSGWSGSGSGTTNAPATTAPGAPRGLTATATGPARIDLSWDAPASDGGASISGYKIEVSTNGTSFTGLVDSQTARTYSHTGLSAGSVRHYRVSAINSVGAGAVSATAMDTTNVFVRNTGQGSDANNSSASEQSQRFTTGDHSPGYTLASIEVVSADAEGDDFDAAVWTVNATTGHPVASHATLSSPAGFTAGTLVFTAAANTTLAANTTYAVVLTPDSGGTITYGGTTSEGEDTGAASGWDIEDDHEYKSGSIWRDNGSGRSLRIVVRGAARTNSAPVFNPATVARAVAENTVAGQDVGAPVTATDADTVTGDTLTYTLGGTDEASFDIVAGSGQIQTKAAPDHEAKSSYTVIVTATDGSGVTATATVTISVTDVDEAPSAPAAPLVAAVSGSTASLKVTWTAPGNDGKPAIASYDVRYRTGGGSWEDGPQNQTGLTATIAGLTASTTYEAQVRATNDEGDSGWSGSGSGTTNAPANSTPVFSPVTVARAVAENTGAGENVGAVVTATDADTATGDTLTYTLGGADAASFDIVAGSGQIQTKAALNHEAKASYTVTVTATDGSGATATATVTITVTDVDEAPSAPAAPLVAAVPGSTASLKVTWTAPGNDGKPAIASYDVRYRTGGGSWEDGPQNQTGLTATIAGLSASTTYEAQVRATNDEGDSGWSGSGEGTTNAPAAPGAPRGLSATATGPARIDLSWDAPASDGGASISGYKIEVSTNGTSFTGLVDSQTARTYSHTGLSAGSVRHYRVSAINSVGAGAVSATAMDTTNVFVRNTGQGSDANNSSASEQSQRFTTGDHSPGYTLASIEVVSADAEGDDFDAAVWTVNATTGHPVASHATLSSPAGFTAGTLVFTAAANTTLAANTTYAVVLTPDSGGTITYGGTTSDGEDTGAASGWDIEDDHEYKSGSIWRDNGSGRSLRIAVRGAARANSTPVFNPAAVARAVAENTGAGENVGAVVTATDADTVAGDTLTYTLGGADAASFDIVAGSGQIQTKAALNHEAKASYTVTVTATDGSSATATATVTISVTDVDEAPSAPSAPLVAAVPGSTASLKVTWTAPGNDGKPAIASYDVRYRTGGGSWEDGPQNQTGLTATIAGLSASTTYEAQVRATNDEGDSGWSGSGEGTTNAPANSAPVFNPVTVARAVAENTGAGENVGAVVTATDADTATGDTLTYTLGGADAASFDIVAGSGQIQTKAVLNHEAKSSYTVTVTATDGSSATATATVTISVTDVDEAPSAPAAPLVAAVPGSTASLKVTWTAPGNDGKPAIASYDVRYRTGGGSWEDGPQNQTGLTATIAGLSASTTYEAQVRATNDEGDSGWSGSGSGTTNAPAAPAAPGAPRGLTATASGPARIDLSWDAPASDGGASISGYKIEVSTNGTSFTGLVDSQTARTYSHTGLSTGDTRHYRVSAINSVGASAVSNVATDTTNVFVRNTGQGSRTTHSSGSDQAQRFTTGGHSPGYTLTSIEIVSADTEGDDFTVAIWTVDTTTGHPASSHATLTTTDSFAAGTLTFTAPADTTLKANTTYAVVTSLVGSGDVTYSGTTSNGEDTGAATDWSIEDDHEYKSGSIWRDNGSGRSLRIAVRGAARTNSTPVLASAVARSVAENTGAGQNVGAAVTATDADTVAGDTLTYTLGGTDAASFDIVAGSGQIQTKVALDHEAKASYSVTVTATDGSNATATATVTISVTDVDEAPAAPAAPLVAAVPGSTASLKVTWTAPGNDGKPAIASYDVRYRTGGGSWEDGPQNQTGLTATIAGLSASTTYEAQVRATNDEGDSGWSGSGEGTTNAPANSAPVFNPVTVARAVAENTGAGENVGAVVTATDADTATGDTLTYTLGGADAASFDIVAGSGQIQTKAALNHEAKASYTVTVTATDGSSATATATVTISVTDVDEAPSAPAAPLVAAVPGSSASLKVTWTAPGNDGKPAIASYDVRYRTGGGSWEDGPQNQTGLTATIAGLSASTTYEAQVRATNDEGDSGWSGSGEGTTNAPAAPGAPRGLTATASGPSRIDLSWDAPASDGGASISGYKIEVSTNGTSFTGLVDSQTARTYSHTGLSANTTRHYRVSAINSVGTSAVSSRATATTPAAATAPGAPRGLSATATGPTRIDLSWDAPASDGGASISGYKIEVSTNGTTFATLMASQTARTYSHTGLSANSTRHYRVSAINRVGTGTVSDTARGVTGAITTPGPTPIGVGGGGGASGPTPSTIDFEWTVKHDIDPLDEGNDTPTGMWSDGATLWLLNNAAGAGDAVYAYDLETGERVEEREFELAERNRAPRGIWSDGETVWVSDSGRDRLFAYDLASAERLEERDRELHDDNVDARGIWSGGEVMWVLDNREDALFAYGLESGALLGTYALGSASGAPHGLWSDGVTIWASDHGAKALVAYRLPAAGTEEAPAEADLERVRDEDFRKLSRASNNSPRGIWSDGVVMYVADASDGKVYSYNMPGAIDARLASLGLEGVDIGEFDPGETDYEGGIAGGVTETVVTAEAVQQRAAIVIDPPDADGNGANGHQIALEGLAEITVAVTSADGLRTRTYRVRLAGGEDEPWPHCLRGAVAEGFSLVVYEGGSVEDLRTCAESRNVDALYVLHEGVYLSYILGAPDFVNAGFSELYAGGVPALTPLVATGGGPPSADPVGDLAAPRAWPGCLRGEVVEGFSLVIYRGGSVEELESCARSRGVTALYALADGEWVSYIMGAPAFVNEPFSELFADGAPAGTALVARSEAPVAAEQDGEGAPDN